MTHSIRLAALVAATLLAGGCYGQVHRTITIESEPPGARCWLNDNEVGRTPCIVPFTWYGTYGVRLEYPGYQILVTEAKVGAPIYEWIPLDLAFETVVPGEREDAHHFSFALKEAQPEDPTALRQRAEALRRDAATPVP